MQNELGAYGLHLPDFPGSHWLSTIRPGWPAWNLKLEAPVTRDVEELLAADTATVSLRPEGRMQINRWNQTATVHTKSRPPDAAWVHPLLAPLATIAAEWAGRLAFHGGSFLSSSGHVWGVLGHRTQGKSSVLAGLLSRGMSIVADDLLITDGHSVFTGPRCVDLRAETARHYGLGDDLGVIGTRRRWRVDLPRVKPVFPLGGILVLGWGDKVTVDPISLEQRFAQLQQGLALRRGQQHHLVWLRVAALPMLRIVRPRDWAYAEPTLDLILNAAR